MWGLGEEIRRKASGMQPCNVWFDSFGFSRGATASRDFANGIKDGEFACGSSKLETKYMELSDTVSAVGETGNSGNYEGVRLNTNPRIADNAVSEDVPFNDPMPSRIAGKGVSINSPDMDRSDLEAYYQALKDGSVSSDMERDIRRRYAHFSVNNESWFLANYPDPTGARSHQTL